MLQVLTVALLMILLVHADEAGMSKKSGSSSDIVFVAVSCVMVLCVAMMSCRSGTRCNERPVKLRTTSDDDDECVHAPVDVRPPRGSSIL